MKERTDPIVTVVMPSLNVGPYIRECLESVLAQTLKDLEVICVDAGSTDGTLETIRELAARDSRIRLIMSDRRSYGRQMNLGIEAARGKYLGIVETDDAVVPNMYHRLLEVAERNDADIVRADYYRFTGEVEDGEREPVACTDNSDLYGRTVNPKADRRVFRFTINCGNLYALDFLRTNGISFNETPGASYQDIGFYLLTTVFAQRIHFLHEPFYLYRQDNPGSSINSSAKVYAVCGEFEFVRKRMIEKRGLYECFKCEYGRELFFSYQSTLHRIDGEFRPEFVRRFSRDLTAGYLRGEIVRDNFSEKNWSRVLQIMTMPLAYLDLMFPPVSPERQLVVSLTTFPQRVLLVYKVIDNMLRQTLRPDKVVLYLADEEFADRRLPENLTLRLARDSRLEVRYVENLRSHKKYIKAFHDFPDANIVLIDDDIVYPDTMLRDLVVQHRRMPHAVIALRTHVISMTKDGAFANYGEWMAERKFTSRPSALILATTGGGTLFPPGILPPSAFDRNNIRRVALTTDDLWIKWHLLMAGVPVVWIDKYGQPRLQQIAGTQTVNLVSENIGRRGNDHAWKNIRKLYSVEDRIISKILWECYRQEYPSRFLPHTSWFNRKLRGMRLCLVENGLRYTFFHIFEKAFGKCNEIARKLSRPKGWQSPHRPPARRVRAKGSAAPSVPAVVTIKVSVIVPVYNAADYLQQCLDSVLGQTIRSLEILCVDDGSTDSSLDILRECAARDRRVVVLTQRNAGASVARNLALSYARGEFVAFLDPDDYYPDPTSLQKLYDAARRQNVLSACGYLERFDPETPDNVERPTRYRRPTGVYTYADNPFDFGYQLHIFNRRMLQDAGIGFPVVSRYQDPLFLVRALFAAKRFCAVDVAAYRYRLGHQQINWAKDDWRKARDLMRIMADIVDFARQNGLTQLIERTRNRIENDYCELFSGDSGRILSSYAEYERLKSAMAVATL